MRAQFAGVDALAHEWLDLLLYAFLPLSLIELTVWMVRKFRRDDSDCAKLAGETVGRGDCICF